MHFLSLWAAVLIDGMKEEQLKIEEPVVGKRHKETMNPCTSSIYIYACVVYVCMGIGSIGDLGMHFLSFYKKCDLIKCKIPICLTGVVYPDPSSGKYCPYCAPLGSLRINI